MDAWQIAWPKSRDNPLLFVTEVIGFTKLWGWQRDALSDIAAQIAKNPPRDDGGNVTPIKIAIKAGHSVGKTALICWLLLWLLTTRKNIKAVVSANSEDQISDTIWPELGVWLDRLPEALRERLDKNNDRVCLRDSPDTNFVSWRVVNQARPESVQGVHADHVALFVDEASGIPNAYFDAVMGSLSAPRLALMLLTGNPTRNNGFFYDVFTKLRGLWLCRTVNCEDVPGAQGHIQEVLARSGRDSNEYRIRVLGEFPTEEDDSVIPLSWCEAALKRDVEAVKTFAPVWGVDVARFGDDKTALAKRQCNRLLEPVKVRSGMDTMQVAGWVKNEWDQTAYDERPGEILVDVIGIGAGVVDRLRELKLPVRGINVGESASANERYMRLRDELWFKGREWFEAKDCILPEDPDLISELTGPKYAFTSSGKIQVESKEDMKERLGNGSPDRADAFLLTLAGGYHKAVAVDKYKAYSRKNKRPQGRSWQAA